MVFWIIISFMFLSAMLMTGHLLNKVVLQPVWLCIWSLPWLGFLLKVRVTEMDKGLVNTLQLGDLPVFRWSRSVVPGTWSVDRINGRYRLNRIGTDGLTVHYPWRLNYQPLFLTPDKQISDINGREMNENSDAVVSPLLPACCMCVKSKGQAPVKCRCHIQMSLSRDGLVRLNVVICIPATACVRFVQF